MSAFLSSSLISTDAGSYFGLFHFSGNVPPASSLALDTALFFSLLALYLAPPQPRSPPREGSSPRSPRSPRTPDKRAGRHVGDANARRGTATTLVRPSIQRHGGASIQMRPSVFCRGGDHRLHVEYLGDGEQKRICPETSVSAIRTANLLSIK